MDTSKANIGFYKIIEKRRTVRNFQEKPVEREKLIRILQAGMKAPSNNHLREWHFIFLRDLAKRREIFKLGNAFSRAPDRKFLDETLSKITNPYQRQIYAYSVPIQEQIFLSAPELLVVCFRMERSLSTCQTLFELNNFASIWLAVENILLAMAAEGLFGVTMVPFNTSTLKQLLNLPEDYEIATFIPMGYPKREPPLNQVKIDIEERIHINAW